MNRYRKKPIVIEAMHYDGTRPSIEAISDGPLPPFVAPSPDAWAGPDV